MPGLTRIAAFAGLLAVIFAGAWAAGGAIDANPPNGGEPADHMADDDTPMGPRGLAVAEHGARLELAADELAAGRSHDFRFTIVDDDGEPIRDFDVEHERRMHLIVVRRDLSGYQHLHPRQLDDGSWRVAVRLDEPGSYRVFADFSRDDEPQTLGADVHVSGAFEPRPLPPASDLARTADGYEVALSQEEGELSFAVSRDGRPVTDIEPYLGARGHLVVLREGDLAYSHVHPDEDEPAFDVEYPTPGRYRLFLQFKHDGRIHTAEFTREVSDATGH